MFSMSPMEHVWCWMRDESSSTGRVGKAIVPLLFPFWSLISLYSLCHLALQPCALSLDMVMRHENHEELVLTWS